MATIFKGKLKEIVSANGTVYFKGWCGGDPILVFKRKSNDGTYNIILDVDKIKWISEQEDKQPEPSEPQITTGDDMPF